MILSLYNCILWLCPIWGSFSFSYLEVYIFCQIWQVFSHFKSYFSACPFSPILLGLWWHACWFFSSTGPWSSVNFFFSVYLCYLDWVIYTVLYSRPDDFLYLLHSVIDSVHWVFYFDYSIFNSKLSIWFLLISSISFLRLSISLLRLSVFFICFHCVCILKSFIFEI